MACGQSGHWYKSEPKTVTATTSGVVVPLNFFDAALVGARAPRIDRALLKVTNTGSTAAGETARGDLNWHAISSLQLDDQFGPRIVNISGDELHKLSKYEWGSRFQDPPNLGASAASSARECFMPLPIGDTRLSVRPQDGRWDAAHLRGGQCIFDITVGALGVTTNLLTTTQTTVELWLHIVDEGKDLELPRTVFRKQVIIAAQQSFALGNNGLIRYALQYIGTVGARKATPDTWAAHKINSQLLGQNQVDEDVLVNDHRIFSPDPRPSSAAGVYQSEDPVDIGTVIPLVNARWAAPMLAEAPIGSNLDWLTDLTYGSGTFNATNVPKMLLALIEDRPGAQCGNNVTAIAAVQANGKSLAPSGVAEVLRHKIPVQVTRG